MGKTPSFQFYPMDWCRDLDEHPLEIEGAWIRIICRLWWAEPRGVLTRSIDQWARILRVSHADVTRIFDYISTYKIGDISVTCNGDVTVMSRRMFRDDKARRQATERQRRKRCHAQCHADVTDASSSSSSIYIQSSSNNLGDNTTQSSRTIVVVPDDDVTQNVTPDVTLGVTDADIASWKSIYPRIDVTHVIRQVAEYARTKQIRNPRAYIMRALEKADREAAQTSADSLAHDALSLLLKRISERRFRGNGSFLHIDTDGLPPDSIRDRALTECPCPNIEREMPYWQKRFLATYNRIAKEVAHGIRNDES